MGDRVVDCRVRTVAEELGISIGAVSNALKGLEKKQLIGEITITRAVFSVKPRFISDKAKEYLRKHNPNSEYLEHEIVQRNEQSVQQNEQAVQRSEQNVRQSEQSHIYGTRTRSKTLNDLNQTLDDTVAPPAPTAEPVEAEVLEQPKEQPAHQELPHEETHQEQPCVIESKDLVCASETKASGGEDFSAAANAEILRDIERIAHNWRLRPWMADASKFKPEMVKAVWQCNPVYYSFEGTKTPNQTHIIKALKLRDNQLKSLDLAAINAYHELHQWWSSAQALANPHVQHAFVAAAAQSKEQVEEMERQRQAQIDAERLRKDLGL